MANTASQDFMDSLHKMTAETMQAEIQGYKDRGEPVPPSLLANVIKFLKDNNVTTSAGADSPRMKALAVTLPFPSKDVLKSVQ